MADETTNTSTNAEDATSTDGAESTDTQETGQPAELGDAGKKALAAERAQRKDAEQKAKQLEAELAEFRMSQMSEQEQAIEKARAEARAEALAEAGSSIAAAEFKAAASGRLDETQLATLLEGLDAKAFLTDDGQVDSDRIKSFMDGIVPAGEQRTTATDLGQGARNESAALNGDPLLRDLKSKLGIR